MTSSDSEIGSREEGMVGLDMLGPSLRVVVE